MEADADREKVLVIDDRDTPLTLADERIACLLYTSQRVSDLEVLLCKIYEDHILGKLSDSRRCV